MSCCLSSSSSSLRMKMISLLLLILSSCLCAATFVVNVTQSSYEAEENHSITLEWTFTTRTQGSYKYIKIICDLTDLVLIEVNNGVENSKSQHDQFSGRVHIDKDVLREGRIRLHVSRLRTEDSGLYLCDVKTEDGFNSGRCRLNVSAADQLQPPTENLQPDSRGRIGVHVSLGLLALTVIIYFLYQCYIFKKQTKKEICLQSDVEFLRETRAGL
ncbi:uncharacterized protein LOC106944225 isoform X2 [Poecilia latipinna]|uniref:uncharacterized protein LOC106944225 isoform X2 n=1 Tax=Poecilia latipinna TaxID=48699 RepID=UPI00072E12F4|nr:PREDICTED: uncharacterized protein LOC106944225 isoform X2 [Poecilia latipinna]